MVADEMSVQRALYAKNGGPNRDPTVVAAIERAKTFERRRCGHLMDEDPQTEYECMMSVVDPKKKGENKFRYVVVTQDDNLVRDWHLRPCVFLLTDSGCNTTAGKVTVSGAYAAHVREAQRRGRLRVVSGGRAQRANGCGQILEPMASSSAQVREREERAK